MPAAFSLIKNGGSYRGEAFRRGLERHGYTFEPRWRKEPGPRDVILMWNRLRTFEPQAALYQAHGARVLVVENGYLGTDPAGEKLYAVALDHHNGRGRWYVGDQARREFDLKPWRTRGDQVVILPQRGIGEHGIAMPRQWARTVRDRLAKITRRPIITRPHPGASKTDPWPDLKGAHCAVTWGSGAGIKAIAHGIPVFHALDGWIGAPAALPLGRDIERCYLDDRGAMFRRLSWAQWSISEIESGEAFARLIDEGGGLLRSGLEPVQDRGGRDVRGAPVSEPGVRETSVP